MYTLEQQKAHRKLWVEALRSGKYQQTTGYLHDRGAFCCLGVACLVADLTPTELDHSGTLGDFPEVMEFYGVRTSTGDYADTDLALQNDSGATFAQIADIIESEPDGLFAESARP